MNFEEFMNIQDDFAWRYDGWHCVYCGEVIDPLILVNRTRIEEPQISAAMAGRER